MDERAMERGINASFQNQKKEGTEMKRMFLEMYTISCWETLTADLYRQYGEKLAASARMIQIEENAGSLLTEEAKAEITKRLWAIPKAKRKEISSYEVLEIALTEK